MNKPKMRLLITGAGTGPSGNLIRAFRAIAPQPHIVGINDDRFVLKQSLADRNYLAPAPNNDRYIDAMLEIIKRERINVALCAGTSTTSGITWATKDWPGVSVTIASDCRNRCMERCSCRSIDMKSFARSGQEGKSLRAWRVALRLDSL